MSDTSAETSAIHPAVAAASLLALRERQNTLEVLMIRRAKSMRFGGGASAFPGGKVDSSDHPDGPQFLHFSGLPRADAMARVAVARELFEECGILLSDGPDAPAGLVASLRQLSDRHSLSFADILARLGHQLDAGRLVPFARWMPPRIANIQRYDTRFYVAAIEKEPHADGHEVVRSRWATPKTVLRECADKEVRLLFPTRCNVERLATYPSLAAALNDPTPPPLVTSTLKDGFATIPEGIGYTYTREALSWATPDGRHPQSRPAPPETPGTPRDARHP